VSYQGYGRSNQINDNSKNVAAPDRPDGQSGLPAFTRPAKINSLEILLPSKFPTKTLHITDLKNIFTLSLTHKLMSLKILDVCQYHPTCFLQFEPGMQGMNPVVPQLILKAL